MKEPLAPVSDRITGDIYKIERLAVHDGPGIRTVVFLKGCPLSCIWCASPESQRSGPEIGFRRERCTACMTCADVCVNQATFVSENGHVIFNRDNCVGCGMCVNACPSGARILIGRQVNAGWLMTELEKDSVFYHRSGGGITLSGGEPAFQPAFSETILKKALSRGFHTAMETCAFADWADLEPLLACLDLVYVDIKHMAEERHKQLTGKSNTLVLENIRRIDDQFPSLPLIIRVPVIPGINDTEENIGSITEFATKRLHLARIELLPYHRFGVATYDVLGKTYPLAEMKSPPQKGLEKIAAQMAARGLQVQIGG